MTEPDPTKYVDLPEDELYELLGAALLGDGPGIAPDDPDEAARYGKQWFTRHYALLQQRICLHQQVKGFGGNSTSDRIVDVVAISEALRQLGDEPIKAALVAALVVRIGLGLFCAGIE